MEINATTTGGKAAAALIAGNAPVPGGPAVTLSADQQTAITSALETLLAEAGIADSDLVDVHLAASVEGKWAVLRVAHIVKEA